MDRYTHHESLRPISAHWVDRLAPEAIVVDGRECWYMDNNPRNRAREYVPHCLLTPDASELSTLAAHGTLVLFRDQSVFSRDATLPVECALVDAVIERLERQGLFEHRVLPVTVFHRRRIHHVLPYLEWAYSGARWLTWTDEDVPFFGLLLPCTCEYGMSLNCDVSFRQIPGEPPAVHDHRGRRIRKDQGGPDAVRQALREVIDEMYDEGFWAENVDFIFETHTLDDRETALDRARAAREADE